MFDPVTGVGYEPLIHPTILSSTQANFNLTTEPGGDADNLTLTVTIPRRARIIGFLATANLRTLTAGQEVLIRCRRGDTPISTATLNADVVAIGIVFVETAGFLSGIEVLQGDTFSLAFRKLGSGSTWTMDGALNVIVQEI